MQSLYPFHTVEIEPGSIIIQNSHCRAGTWLVTFTLFPPYPWEQTGSSYPFPTVKLDATWIMIPLSLCCAGHKLDYHTPLALLSWLILPLSLSRAGTWLIHYTHYPLLVGTGLVLRFRIVTQGSICLRKCLIVFKAPISLLLTLYHCSGTPQGLQERDQRPAINYTNCI